MRPHDRSRLRLLLAAPLGAAVLLLLSSVAFAQGGPGLFIRTACNTTTIPNPVTGSTWCFNSTTRVIMVWNGSTFVSSGGVSGAGTQGTPATWTDSTTLAAGGAYLDVTQYGTWNGTSAQNRAAIQAAISAAPSTGATIVLPTGTFTIDCSTTISITKPMRIVGQGRSQTNLVATCAATPIFTVSTSSSVKFEHLSLTAGVSRTSGGYGILVQGSGGTENQNSYFNNVQFDQQDVGLYCSSCSSFVLVASYFTNNESVGLFVDNTDTPDAGDSKILGNHFIAGVASTHIFHQAAGGMEIVGNKFSGGLNAYSLNVRNSVNTSVLQVVGNSFEDFASHGIVMTTTGTGVYGNFTIGINEFRAVSSTGPAITLDAAASSSLASGVITGNIIFIDQDSTRGIEVIHAQDVLVADNTVNCGSSSSTTAVYVDAVAMRPSVTGTKSNGCAIVVENNGTLVATLTGPLGLVPLGTSSGETGQLDLYELRANGTEKVTVRVPDALSASWTMTLPDNDGTSGDCLVTDGNGVTSWSNVCTGGGGSGITSLGGQTGAVQTFVNGANITVTSASDQHTIAVTGQIPVSAGGTGLASGTSGGIPAYTGSATITSSGVLTNHALVIGGGAGAVPKTIAALTNGQLAVGSTGADPVPATITAGTGISVTNGAGTITIANTGATGSGTAGRCAFWSASTVLSSDGGCLYDSTNDLLSVTANASTLQTPPSDTRIVAAGVSGSNAYITADGYGGQGGILFRRANGTPAAPTALLADAGIGAVQGLGYSGAAYTSTRASVGFFSKQNWTGSNQGTYMTFGLTPNNSTVFDEYARLDPDLGLRLRGPSPWTDVLSYGAKCDGTTDDTTAINNAINSGASVIRFPIGTCRFTTLTPVSGQTFVGAGRTVSVLKRLSGTADMISVGRNVTSLMFADLGVDGNNADGNGLVIGDGVAGSFDTSTSIIVLRVNFTNFAASSSSTNAMLYANTSRKIVAIFDSVFTGGSVGIHVVNTSPPIYVSRTVVQTAANAGMLGAGTGFGALVFGSWFYSNRDAFSFSLNQLHIQHSYIENSTRYGVDFTGTAATTGDLRIIDNFVTCPASGTAVLLNITNDATPIDVRGNTLIGGSATCTPIVFTSFPSSPTYSALIASNKIDGTVATTTFSAPAAVVYGNTASGVGNVFFAGAGNFSGPYVALGTSTVDTWGTASGSQLYPLYLSRNVAVVGSLTSGQWALNGYFDGTDWRYIDSTNKPRNYFMAQTPAHDWRTASAGTAGNVITWTDEMSLDGGLKIGSPTGSFKGVGTINAAGAYYANGTIGGSGTISVRKGDDSGACNLVFSNGLYISTTC